MFQGELREDLYHDPEGQSIAKEKKNIFHYLDGNEAAPNEGDKEKWVDRLCSFFQWFVKIEPEYLKTEIDIIKEELNKTSGRSKLTEYFEKVYKELKDAKKSKEYLTEAQCLDFIQTIFNLGSATEESAKSKKVRENQKKLFEYLSRAPEQAEYELEFLAESLYGLIHAKYITTRPGLIKMAVLFQNFTFGKCPRYRCGGCPVLPLGRSDDPVPDDKRLRPVCVFCPLCHDIYRVQHIESAKEVMREIQRLNGAFFGTSFPGLFMVTFPPFSSERPVNSDDRDEKYERASVMLVKK